MTSAGSTQEALWSRVATDAGMAIFRHANADHSQLLG